MTSASMEVSGPITWLFLTTVYQNAPVIMERSSLNTQKKNGLNRSQTFWIVHNLQLMQLEMTMQEGKSVHIFIPPLETGSSIVVAHISATLIV